MNKDGSINRDVLVYTSQAHELHCSPWTPWQSRREAREYSRSHAGTWARGQDPGAPGGGGNAAQVIQSVNRNIRLFNSMLKNISIENLGYISLPLLNFRVMGAAYLITFGSMVINHLLLLS